MWLRRIIVAAAAYALFAGGLATVYVVVQQNGRHAVEDAPRVLLSASAGEAPLPTDRLDLENYLGAFWVRYDAAGEPTAGDGYLGGVLARVPHGVLQSVRATGEEDAVTWEPEPGLRFAIVAQGTGDGVIVAGQSLQPTELRAERTLLVIGLALVAGLFVVGAAVAADGLVARRRSLWKQSVGPPYSP